MPFSRLPLRRIAARRRAATMFITPYARCLLMLDDTPVCRAMLLPDVLFYCHSCRTFDATPAVLPRYASPAAFARRADVCEMIRLLPRHFLFFFAFDTPEFRYAAERFYAIYDATAYFRRFEHYAYAAADFFLFLRRLLIRH